MPFILSILGYIFDISKKTGILTHVKMPVFRQSETYFKVRFLFYVCGIKRRHNPSVHILHGDVFHGYLGMADYNIADDGYLLIGKAAGFHDDIDIV